MTKSTQSLRDTFDGVADLYDAVRPGYPQELFDELLNLSGTKCDSTILEIGCGTGQATLPLAKHGFNILAIELGENPANLARKNLSSYPKVQIHTGAFEDWIPGETKFDLIVSATAFHWLDQNVAYSKMAQVLKGNGAVGLFWNVHIHSEQSKSFFDDVQTIFQETVPELTAYYSGLPKADEIQDRSKRMVESRLFTPVQKRQWQWDEVYDNQTYLVNNQ